MEGPFADVHPMRFAEPSEQALPSALLQVVHVRSGFRLVPYHSHLCDRPYKSASERSPTVSLAGKQVTAEDVHDGESTSVAVTSLSGRLITDSTLEISSGSPRSFRKDCAHAVS